ncbi:MAG: efflux RND transporter permease subunit, partial [Desulfotomaculaceae bacterium]|nr:efflux RND transporter permease subunit [Desulfotomaculaceae bacterium]
TDEALPEGKTINPVIHFGRLIGLLKAYYGRLIAWSLQNRKKEVGFTVALFIASVAAGALIVTEFIPNMDQGELTVNIDMPAGTKVEETTQVAREVESIAREQVAEIEQVFTSVGGDQQMAFLGASSSDQASLTIKLVPLEERDITTDQAAEKLRRAMQDIPGADITISTESAMAYSSSAIDISVRGDDLEVLEQLGVLLEETVNKVAGTRNVESSLSEVNNEMRVTVDREQAARYGLSANQILLAVSTNFDGRVVGRMRTGDDEVDVRMLYPEDAGQGVDSLKDLTIVSPTGARVPLSIVADIESSHIPQQIQRTDETREVKITADISGRDAGSVNQDLETELGKLKMPAGYELQFGGQAEDMTESFTSLGLALLLSMLLVFMVMCAQFESVFQPFIIMFALPPTFIGAVFGLLVTGKHLGVTAMIGAIMLVGIVLNNSIVLVDYINVLRRRGHPRDEAILMAGPVRLRPILMTALVTVLAILPMAFGTGEGSEAQAPMAIVIAFGLTFSTLITLVLVPVVYASLDDFSKKMSSAFGKLSGFKFNRAQ